MKIHIIYASASGNVELVAEFVGKILKDEGNDVVLHRAEITKKEVLLDNSDFIFATSTWEHGEVNPYFNNLLKEMRQNDLKTKRAGLIGLGDKRYEEILFCNGIEVVKEAFLAGGGKQIYETLKINGDPCDVLETTVKDWTENFYSLLKAESK